MTPIQDRLSPSRTRTLPAVRRTLASALVLVGLTCATRHAHAQRTVELADRPSRDEAAPARERRVGVAVEARTDVPLFAGAAGYVEHGPTRLRLTGALGVLPSGYARLVNNTLSGAGAYDERLGRALDSTLSTGFAWNANVGFRPFARHGLLLEVGYGTATLVANGDARSLVANETGLAVPEAPGVDTSFAFRSTLHLVDGRVGWEWLVEDHVVIGASLGVSRAIHASTSLDQRYLGRAPALAQNALAQGLGTLDSAVVRYGWVPSAGLSAGYRF